MPDGVSWPVYACISLASSAVPVAVTNPLDVLKTRRQSRRRGALSSDVASLLKKEGFKGVRLGTALSVTGYSVSPMVKMCAYQACPSLGVENTGLRGALSGVATAVITCPLWVLKTRTQLTPGSRLAKVASETLRLEGVRGFYAGIAPACLNKSIEFCVFFLAYEACKRVAALDGARHRQSAGSSGGGGVLWAAEIFSAAGFSRMVATLVAYPCNVVTTRAREPASWGGSRGGFAVASEVVRQRALFSGLAPHLMKAVPFTAMYFTAHETLMSLFEDVGSVQGSVAAAARA